MVEKQHHTLADRKPELVLLELLWLLNISCLSASGIVSAVLLIKCSNATKNYVQHLMPISINELKQECPI